MSAWLRDAILALDLKLPTPKPVRVRSGKPTVHPTRTCKAVLDRLRECGVPLSGADENYRVVPTRAGPDQRSAGAWSWCIEYVGQEESAYSLSVQASDIGGHYPASVCGKPGASVNHSIGGWTLEPSREAEIAFMRKRYGDNFADDMEPAQKTLPV